MLFYFRDISATYLIEENPFWFLNRNYNKKNPNLTGFGLASMTNQMANSLMDVTVGVTTIKYGRDYKSVSQGWIKS